MRTKVVQVRITRAMREKWQAEADKQGLTLSEFIRRVCNEESDALYREMVACLEEAP